MTCTTDCKESPAPEAVLSAVADEHRRAALRALNDADEETVPFDTLADRVAERLQTDDASADHRQQVRTALHHVHLPKLADSGMVVHDTAQMQVSDCSGDLGQKLLVVIESHEQSSTE